MKHIHILGICGTFMGSLAIIARELGFKVTGSDENVYPPMSTYLLEQGVDIIQGFGVDQLAKKLALPRQTRQERQSCKESTASLQTRSSLRTQIYFFVLPLFFHLLQIQRLLNCDLDAASPEHMTR